MAAEKIAHLHVWRLDKNTSLEDMKNYVQHKFEDVPVEVEKLNAKGNYASFRVSANFSVLDKLQNPENWPKNVAINRFFFGNRNKLSQQTSKTLLQEK